METEVPKLPQKRADQAESCGVPGAGERSAGECDRASGVHNGAPAAGRDYLDIELAAERCDVGSLIRSAVTAEETAKILRLHHAEQWPIGTISRQLGRHHDTIERVLAESGLEVHKQSTRTRLVDPYISFLKETLQKYPKLRASRLWAMTKARGYTGSKSGFRAIVKRLRPRPAAEAFVRRTVLPGQEAQVDWAHFGTVTIGRATRTLWAFVMVMSYSRVRFVRFSVRAAMPSFLAGHVEALRFFGAVPRVVLYDNLKSAVIEREGDAIRYHPTLLALSAHYRFEPRACAPYRPNEKGRVERAIRDVRENFFAARAFRSLAELNAEARAWSLEIAKERRIPDARETTCEAGYVEELPKMLELPADDFPIEERVVVQSGKTPYVRFDKNDYSVPHTHVRRQLLVVATDERVRVMDPEAPATSQLIATHTRSFDRDLRIEAKDHLQALTEHKRRAHQSRGFDRIFSEVPSSRAMMDRIAESGGNLGATTSGLLKLLERVGGEMLERAVAEVVAHDQPRLRAIHHVLDRLRRDASQPPPLTVPISNDARAQVRVRPHALGGYDQLAKQREDGDDQDDTQ